MTVPNGQFPIVGVGASAGGIAAMEGLFRGMPEKPDAAFVVVTHLSRDRESLLHEVLERYTTLPVMVATDDMAVEPNGIYVMPANAVLTIANGRLKLRPPEVANWERKPIDEFLGALAEDQGSYAVAVILSGGDGDGTLGAKSVKQHGGLTLAQTSDNYGPRNPGMPESAISSGVIDLAVPVEQMGEQIMAYARHIEASPSLVEEDEKDGRALREARAEIYDLLRSRCGHDFSGYKIKTFMRRVTRRMKVLRLQSVRDYIGMLEREPEEVKNLLTDLLINVTHFFRDPPAFAALEQEVIPKLFEGRGPGDSVRVWVPGCSTGEEVYSLAILMREHLDGMSKPPKVQLFATDIDEPALTVARAGRYPEQLLAGVSSARRKRFFYKDGASYVISAGVRELCIFSPHSVVRDPPFSRIDLVSCRNLLIYLGPDMQNRVIPTFHYALRPGGYMFLGTSESISQHDDLFSTLDKKNRIFQARAHVSTANRPPILLGDPRIAAEMGERATSRVAAYPLRKAVEAQVLERFAPAHVVVNGEGEVVYYSARTGKYLEPAAGAPSRQLLTMARRGLRLDLRVALREAASTRSTVIRDSVIIEDDDERSRSLALTIEPLADRGIGEPLYLVIFEPAEPPREPASRVGPADMAHGTDSLERELRDTRERLQSTIEEYETAVEELKSSNEELVSINEESQSSNEELEASKEEMQSLNEELNTINAELSSKVEELDHANNDLKNLFESTQIATIFLDRDLVIRNFTPAASAFFNLRSGDIGRPLTDLASNLEYPELKEHIGTVFKSGEMVEHHRSRDAGGRHYLTRLIPYRGNDGRIEGVVVTLVNVTSLVEAEEHQKVLIAELNHRVKNMLAVVISIANHTLQKSPSPADFTEALTGRLHAMARSYGLLSETNWKGASVAELVRSETATFDQARFSVSGPDVRLTPQQALSIGMAIHELATNASKYGALSAQNGTVSIEWTASKARFELTWSEKGGPAVEQPDHQGFGLTLIKGEIEYRLRGKVETFFDSGGLKVEMSFDLQP